ncbi:MAG TPA: RidA family protein [Candidatus Binataceae bacterium]|nr:RidA family protein [Candidatus Binataceae bacterium]
MKRAIETDNAPSALGPYSQAVEDGAMVFCSGQIGLDPRTGAIVTGGIEAETRRVLANIREVLSAAGLGFADVVKTTIFLSDLGDFDLVNRIYGEHFEPPFPARSTIEAAALPRKARIEIEAIAMKRRS